MFNNGLPDLSLFCCISLLCMPHCLPTHLTCVVCFSPFKALCAIPIHCTDPLLFNSVDALSFFLTHESPSPATITANSNSNNSPISSLYRVLIASVHLVHEMCTFPLHAHTVSISSTSRVLCLIIMVTLQLLWRFTHAFSITGCYAEIPQPLWWLRLFVFSVTVKLILSVSITRSFSSRIANHTQSISFSFIHTPMEVPLPISLGKRKTTVQATERPTETVTNLQS
jgi:hypothetical protein